MFRISDFSRFTRVTVKALRHYDRIGLLKPARVDARTRYRYYSARQIPRLQRILAMRELGFSLPEVAEVLADGPRGPSVRRLLVARHAEAERQLELARQRLAQLEARLGELDEPPSVTMPDATVHVLPPLLVATRRARVADLDSGAEQLFAAVEADVARAGIRAEGPPVLLYHDRDHRLRDADLEAAVPVHRDARSAGRSRVRELPRVAAAACVTYTGSYDQWTTVVRGLLHWLETRSLAPAGPVREVFLQFSAGDWAGTLPPAFLADRAEDMVTEMQIPVRTEGSSRSRSGNIRRVAPPKRRSSIVR